MVKNRGTVTLSELIDQVYRDNIVPEGNIIPVSDNRAYLFTVEGYIFELKAENEKYLFQGNIKDFLDANYLVAKADKLEPYSTLQDAYNATISGGEDTTGGTIFVLKDVEDTAALPNHREGSTTPASIIVDKTISIDTNGKKLTTISPIWVDSETLTIKGNGEIYCKNDYSCINSNGGNIVTIDKPTIKSYGVGMMQLENTSGTITLNGGYIIGEGRSGLQLKGTGGSLVVNNTCILAYAWTKNGITIYESSTANVLIEGNSIIGNGITNEPGLGATESSTSCSSISKKGSGNLTLKGNAKVTAGLYGSNALLIYSPITLTIEDNASLYAANARTLLVKANGTTLNINTKGIICRNIRDDKTGDVPIGIDTGVNNVNCNIQSGIFASSNTKPLQKVQSYMTNYPEEETQQDIEYYYFDSEDPKTLKTVVAPNLYVVKIGVN